MHVDGLQPVERLGRVSDWEAEAVSLADSWATLSTESVANWTFATTRLRIGLVNAFGELMGAKAWPEVILVGGEWASELGLSDAGTISGDIRATGTRDTITVTVTVDAKVLQTFTIEVTGLSEEATTPPPSEPDDAGCASAGGTHLGGILMALVCFMLGLRSRRREGLRPSAPQVA